MSSITALSETSVIDADKRRRAVLIVIACTLIGATAQVLIKLGSAHLANTGLIATAIGILGVFDCYYGVNWRGIEFDYCFVRDQCN